MKREAFAAEGNPLRMGGPVQFMSDRILGGGTQPSPFVFVSGFLRRGIFGGNSGKIVVAGGVPPYSDSGFPPPGAGGFSGPGNTELTWSGIPVVPYTVTLRDSAGATIVLDLDPTVLAPDSEVPLPQVPPAQTPPVSTTAPTIALSSDDSTLTYTPGVWTGNPAPAIVARLFIQGVDTAPALPSMPVLPAWQGKQAGIREAATNAAGGPVYALSQEVLIPDPVSLDQQVEAILSGKDAFVQDATDIATVFQGADTGTPVTAPGQTVRYWTSKWGATAATAIAATGQGPLWTGSALQFDDIDDFMAATVPGAWIGIEDFVAVFGVKTAAVLATNDPILGIGLGSTTGGRYLVLSRDTAGRIVAIVRPGPAGPPETFQSATGVVQPDTIYAVSIAVDYLAGTVVVRLNGAEVINETMAGAAGALSTAPNRVRIARDSNDGAGTFNGLISRWVFARVEVSPTDLATLEAWAREAL